MRVEKESENTFCFLRRHSVQEVAYRDLARFGWGADADADPWAWAAASGMTVQKRGKMERKWNDFFFSYEPWAGHGGRGSARRGCRSALQIGAKS